MASPENKSESSLKIKAYSDNRFTNEQGEFEANLNPNSLKISTDLNYNFSTGLGSSRNRIRYSASMPKILQFKLCFDATGAYRGKKDDVDLQIRKINDFFYDFKSDIKSPYYIRVIWGVIDFKGRLSHLDISYIMFEANGNPLRAEVYITVIECETKSMGTSTDSVGQNNNLSSNENNPKNATTNDNREGNNLAGQENQNNIPGNANDVSPMNANDTYPGGPGGEANNLSAPSPGGLGSEAGNLASDSSGISDKILNDAGGLGSIPNAALLGSLGSGLSGGLLAAAEFSLIKEIFDDIRDAGNWVRRKV